MKFFDANCSVGTPMIRPLYFYPSSKELLADMDRANVEKAMVFHAMTGFTGPSVTNEYLNRELAGHEDRLYGAYVYSPRSCHEIAESPGIFAEMCRNNIRAFLLNPTSGRYEVHPFSCGKDFAEFAERRIPIYLNCQEMNWESIYRTVAFFPENIFIIKNLGYWGCDRYFRPLLEQSKNIYVELADHWVAGGIDDLVRYGFADQLLYGSNAPGKVHGSLMLFIRHSSIPEEAKELIGWRNFERLFDAVNLEAK